MNKRWRTEADELERRKEKKMKEYCRGVMIKKRRKSKADIGRIGKGIRMTE